MVSAGPRSHPGGILAIPWGALSLWRPEWISTDPLKPPSLSRPGTISDNRL